MLVNTNFVIVNYSKRQIEIIEAATKLIGEHGLQGLTIKSLAAAMNFSEPALYRHFKDKTAILESVLHYYKQLLKEGLTGIIYSQNPCIEKVKGIVKFQFNHFTQNPAVIMVIFAETSFQYNNSLSRAVSEILHQKREMLTDIVRVGQEEGGIRMDIDAGQLAELIMGSMRFIVLRWRLSKFNFNLLEEGEKLCKSFELILKKE